MKKSVLSYEEYNLLSDILSITTSIQKIYNTLYQLEISNRKDSVEYKKNFEYLKMTLEVEEELYCKINKKFAEKIYVVIDKFLNEQNSAIIKRILNNISDRFMVDELSAIELIPEEIADSFIGENLEGLNEEIDTFISSGVELYKIFRKDVLLASLLMLKDYINDEKYNKIKKSLIRYKYVLSFKNRDVETNLLDNDFEILDKLCINSQVLAHYYSIDKQEYISMKENYCFNGVINEFEHLMEKKDSDYQGEKGQILLIIKQCMLRAYYLLMENETIKEVIEEFYFILSDDNYMDEHFNDEKSEKMIIDSLKLAEKDKSKRLVLTIDD